MGYMQTACGEYAGQLKLRQDSGDIANVDENCLRFVTNGGIV